VYRVANREKIRAENRKRMQRWRRDNPDRDQATAERARRALKERDPDYHRRWYSENREQERQRTKLIMRRLRKERPELERAARARYRKRNADAIRLREGANTHQRRAQKASTARSILGGYSRAYMVTVIADVLSDPCAYCGGESATLDHIVPLSRGGLHIPANLAPACHSCNSSKCNRLLHEWSRTTGCLRPANPG
jgi:5-methylcytosine-specific restriction endonuclease McrA